MNYRERTKVDYMQL